MELHETAWSCMKKSMQHEKHEQVDCSSQSPLQTMEVCCAPPSQSRIAVWPFQFHVFLVSCCFILLVVVAAVVVIAVIIVAVAMHRHRRTVTICPVLLLLSWLSWLLVVVVLPVVAFLSCRHAAWNCMELHGIA
jgi:hypothetical protein